MKKLTLLLCWIIFQVQAQPDRPLLTGETIRMEGDLSAQMVQGINRFLVWKYDQVSQNRQQEWQSQGEENWPRFLEDKRSILQTIWGLKLPRLKPQPWVELAQAGLEPMELKAGSVKVVPIRWEVTRGIDMAGLLVQPGTAIKARMVMIPDADQYPELLVGFDPETHLPAPVAPALQLAQQGIQVIIPALISRRQDYSGSVLLQIFTNQPHREWIYRQGFNLGYHMIGFELAKIASCIDWLMQQDSKTPVAIAGYGEGGMLALYTAALDNRVNLLMTSGFGGSFDELWQEPVYRNQHGLLLHAGGAELLAMAAQHATVLVEYSQSPPVTNPPLIEGRRGGAAPGKLTTPPLSSLEKEINQAEKYRKRHAIHLVTNQGKPFPLGFDRTTLHLFLQEIKLPPITAPPPKPSAPTKWLDVKLREKQLVGQLEDFIQYELELCERNRNEGFWKQIAHDPEKDQANKKVFREKLHQTLGRITDPLLSPSPRLRLLESKPKWEKYEIVLDVWKDVFAWGILVVPHSAREGRKLPAVVCQHGLEGLPGDMVTRDTSNRQFKTYKAIGLELAERGYVTFSPHNPYRGEDKFRVLQRMANPLGLSLFSVIAGQHQQIVNWLGSLPFVDSTKIGFYGLSYGGKTAMRIPALVEGYALSICSGDFNEWIRKVSTTRGSYSYQFTKEYEIYEWDLGNHFNYAEMAALIAPRPFMVEYGYKDGIGTAEWIGYEFGKVRKHYDLSGLSESLEIDLFNGIHEIHGEKTYRFLDKHLKP